MSKQLKNRIISLQKNISRIHEYIVQVTDDVLKEELEIYLEELEKVWLDFDHNQTQLEESSEAHDETRIDTEKLYRATKCKIRQILNTRQLPVLKGQELVSDHMGSKLQLPTIQVPVFDGKYENWKAFYDVFIALIHSNKTITNIEKLFYLRSYVKGEALNLIEAIQISDTNYETSLKILTDRYDNSQVIINAHLKALFEISDVTAGSAESLRSLINSTKQHLTSLENLSLPVKQWDYLIVYMLTRKLDITTRTSWELHRANKNEDLPKLKDLYTFLEGRCVSLEAVAPGQDRSQKNKPKLAAATTVSNEKRECKLCSQKHNLYQCQKFLGLNHEEKIKAIKEAFACFNCLRGGHSNKQCKAGGCQKCHKRHNTLIHQDQYFAKNNSGSNTELQNEQKTNVTPTLNAMMTTVTNKEVLLMTAKIKVLTIDNSWVNARVLLDNASQINLVTEDFAQRIGFRMYNKQIPFFGVNQAGVQSNCAIMLTFSSQTNKYIRRTEFSILHAITNDLPVQPINTESWNLPSGIQLADPDFGQPGPIDMLIGGEFYSEIIGSQKQALGRNNPFLHSSVFGWLVAGQTITKSHPNTPTCHLITDSELATTCTEYPTAAKRLRNDTYVDDILSGADTLEEAVRLQQDLIAILATAGMELHKWCSNRKELLVDKNIETKQAAISLGQRDTKTLGIIWVPDEDVIQFNANKEEITEMTKREMLSIIASIFDPLGLITPFTLKAKLIMQALWKEKIDWDTKVDDSIARKWDTWQRELPEIKIFKIPRNLISISNAIRFELHGFADASQQAYGAALYLYARNNVGLESVNLICSKSRVAPLKVISVPRLELCAAQLLANLTKKVVESLEINFNKITLWSDSTIVLSWLKSEPSGWNVFVGNRIAEIQEITADYEWKHVATDQNPADLLTRGLTVNELQNSKLWWNGPTWILDSNEEWSVTFNQLAEDDLPDRKQSKSVLTVTRTSEFFVRFSSFDKLMRIVAYLLRFRNNAIKCNVPWRNQLSTTELQLTLTRLIHLAQVEQFPDDLRQLQAAQPLSKGSKLIALAPFLDNDGILRVGGRLDNSLLPFEQIHPIILFGKHQFTKLLIEREHLRLLHAETQCIMNSLRRNYWIINAKICIKQVVHRCVKCFRFRAQGQQQQMGVLPKERVRLHKAFTNTGVDYGGPIMIKSGTRKNAPLQKGYIVLFVCLGTRAVHLEAVTSLSTEAFLNAFKRFIGRRGKPSIIMSDNGTNFKGAHNELHALYKQLHNEETRGYILKHFANEGITWKFIPSHAPHHGGIWESGIKSTKYHLKRIMGNSNLTFEEITTLLIEIESCLNSRPLFPLSNDPFDYEILTPSHFLTGDVLTTYPEPNLIDTQTNRLTRWQYVTKLQQTFWKIWHNQYLTTLQQRSKWRDIAENVKEGTLVLLKEDNLPPLKWVLARVTKIHPGKDGKVRVISILTADHTELVRPITKICPLPIVEDDASRAAACTSLYENAPPGELGK